jgi:hypothetical protein
MCHKVGHGMENEILMPSFSAHTASPDLILAPKVCDSASLVGVKRAARLIASSRVETPQGPVARGVISRAAGQFGVWTRVDATARAALLTYYISQTF